MVLCNKIPICLASGLSVVLICSWFCILQVSAQEDTGSSRFIIRCRDNHAACPGWGDFCYMNNIKTLCQKTCRMCSPELTPIPICVDEDLNCRRFERFCFYKAIRIRCQRTCGTCSGGGGSTNRGWSRWGRWSNCDKSCGSGQQVRTRECRGRPRECPGQEKQTKDCNTQTCPGCHNRSTWCSRYSNYCSNQQVKDACPKTCKLCKSDNDRNQCRPNPCENGGYCSRLSSGYRCRCRSGYSGKNCETATNPCLKKPCQNGGSCRSSGSSYICRCRSGYTGKNCEKSSNPCSKKPCRNGGTCQSSGTLYRCRCKTGYTGKNCETAPSLCSPNPCLNGGTCQVLQNKVKCTCKPGYQGRRCAVANPCRKNPCQNSGTCKGSGSSYSCQCKSGYTGKNCENGPAKSCSPNPCRNGGECTLTSSGKKCKCAIGYRGDNCQTKLRIGEWSPCSEPCEGGTRYRGKSCSANDVLKCPREYDDCNMQECPRKSCSAYRFGSRTQCCSAVSSSCGVPSRQSFQSRIIGGVRSRDGQWPWMAALYYKPTDDFFCAASILSDRWLVSAAHCLDSYSASQLKILVGTNNRASGSKWYDVERKVVHPGYNNPIDDIGLIKVSKNILFSDEIKPICLPNGEKLDEDVTCFASGWGVADVNDIPTRTASNALRHVGLRTLPRDACVQGYKNTNYKNGVNNKIVCSGLISGGKDTCVGDSGGPLACQRKNSCQWYLAGTTSFGPTQCGVGNIPAVFMDVEHYESWIKRYI